MGYYTKFSLSVVDSSGKNVYDEALIQQLRLDSDWAKYAINYDGQSSGEGVKWYEHEQDFIKFSAEYPDVAFVLHGQGEGEGDIWDKYFLRGKLIHTEKFKDLPKVPIAFTP